MNSLDLIRIRKTSGLSQKQMAQMLGISQQHLSSIEMGERALSKSVRQKAEQLFAQLLEKKEDSPEAVEIEMIGPLCRRWNLQKRDVELCRAVMQNLHHNSRLARLSPEQAVRLLELLKKRSAFSKRLCFLEKQLEIFENRYVFNSSSPKSAMKAQEVIGPDGKKITLEIKNQKQPADWERLEKDEAEWTSLQWLMILIQQCYFLLTANGKISARQFAFDYLNGMKIKELKEKYEVARPTEKMIELIQERIGGSVHLDAGFLDSLDLE